jgi:hypothetical protein
MPCDTALLPNQTLTERKTEVKKTVEYIDTLLRESKLKVAVDKKTGAIAFDLSNSERNRVTDACIYRRIMVSGSALARAQIAKAEQLAGRSVNKQALTQGHHSHDGGRTWHHGH